MQSKPTPKEFHAVYERYINIVPDKEIVKVLEEQIKDTISLLHTLKDEQALFSYAPKKWSIKEVIGHLIDTERIMSYRLLSIARGETASLPGYNDNDYVEQADFNCLRLADLLQQWRIVRQSTLQLIQSLNSEAWKRWGKANGSDVTVRAIAYIIAGHELHHRNILIDRYLDSDEFPSA